MEIALLVCIVAAALIFSFVNGFQDSAGVLASPLATRAVKPMTAVLGSAIFNLVGGFFSIQVARTIAFELLPGMGDDYASMILCGLAAALIWNFATWYFGIPASSSLSLFGGLLGSALIFWGFSAVNFVLVLERVFLPSVLLPVIAGLVAFISTRIVYALTSRSDTESRKGLDSGRSNFRYGQLFSSSLLALGHGSNDAQKTMGVIVLALVGSGLSTGSNGVPIWVVATCSISLALGALLGGLRVIHSGESLYSKIRPAQGFVSETSTGSALLAATSVGFAVPTTHIQALSLVGAGLGRKGGAVNWRQALYVYSAWLVTIPFSALLSAVIALITKLSGYWSLVVLIICSAACGILIYKIGKNRKRDSVEVIDGEVIRAGEVLEYPRKKKSAKRKSKKSSSKRMSTRK